MIFVDVADESISKADVVVPAACSGQAGVLAALRGACWHKYTVAEIIHCHGRLLSALVPITVLLTLSLLQVSVSLVCPSTLIAGPPEGEMIQTEFVDAAEPDPSPPTLQSSPVLLAHDPFKECHATLSILRLVWAAVVAVAADAVDCKSEVIITIYSTIIEWARWVRSPIGGINLIAALDFLVVGGRVAGSHTVTSSDGVCGRQPHSVVSDIQNSTYDLAVGV